MTGSERLTAWDALKRAWPILIDRMTKRVDLKWDAGTISVYWAGDVLRADIKFNHTSTSQTEGDLNWLLEDEKGA